MAKESELDYEHYGCWCCGEVEGLTKTDMNTSEVYCGECGEAGILTMTEMLQTLNAAYEAGILYPYKTNGHDLMDDYEDGYDDTDGDDENTGLEIIDEEENDDEDYNQ